MSRSSYPAPAPESAESPLQKRVFEAGRAKRLQCAKSSPEPLISKAAKMLLSAERDVLEALMIIQDLRDTRDSTSATEIRTEVETVETKPVTEAKIIPFPVPSQLKPVCDLNVDGSANDVTETAGFQPIVYNNEQSDIAKDDDSGLIIISADAEDDERIFEDFGFDETDEYDEWDELYVRIKEAESLQFLDRLLKKTQPQDSQESAKESKKKK